MKYFPLVWAALTRRRLRTLLTFLSIVVAFLLFGMLHGVSGGFDAVINAMSDSRLRVLNRVSPTRWLPLAQRDEIRRVPGVTGVVPYAYFGGFYQDARNQIAAGGMDIGELLTVFPEIELPAAQRAAMLRTRTGILVGDELAQRYHWKIGDRIPIGTPIWQQRDGSRNWAFDIVGLYHFRNDALPSDEVWMNFDYLNEARPGMENQASMYIVGIRDPSSAARIAAAIDAHFANSSAPTLTQNEKDWVRARLRRIGNIKLMVNAIVGAVLFTLLALTANTMMQSMRERIAELAVLRTFGYSHGTIAALVVTEALLLCLSAAIVGLLLAALAFPTLFHAMGVGAVPIPTAVLLLGLAIAVGLALVSSLAPIWRALRLDVAAALAAR